MRGASGRRTRLSMSDLLTPPWTLGVFGDCGPYEVLDWLSVRPWAAPAPPVDPNGRDGEWRELAFMPGHLERVPRGIETLRVDGRTVYRTCWLEVPAYLSVGEALAYEREARTVGIPSDQLVIDIVVEVRKAGDAGS